MVRDELNFVSVFFNVAYDGFTVVFWDVFGLVFNLFGRLDFGWV
jgi:hypothetical protein